MEKFTWQDKRWLKYINKGNWQSGSELQEQIDALEMVELMFEYKEISKETIAKKKKELAQAQAAMRKYHAAEVGMKKANPYDKRDASKRQKAKIERAKERRKRGLKGRTGVYTKGGAGKEGTGQDPKATDRSTGWKRDVHRKGLSWQKAK
jgi:hypothetical protein